MIVDYEKNIITDEYEKTVATDNYKLKLNRCEQILDNALKNEAIPAYIPTSIEIINTYDIQIPMWLRGLIETCCGRYVYFATQMFMELMHSISQRKFNGQPVTKDYIIVPNDWIECYEDGYPICTDDDANGCVEMYNAATPNYMYDLTMAIKNRKYNHL